MNRILRLTRTWLFGTLLSCTVASCSGQAAPSTTPTTTPTLTATATPHPPSPTPGTPVPTATILGAGRENETVWPEPQTALFEGVEMVFVPHGCFLMGSEDGDSSDELPVRIVCLAPFWLDKTEVTRAMYADCVAAGHCTQTSQSFYSTRDTQPITRLTWSQARGYCAWRGARLPTEAEWEYAARGPESLVYPWGNELVSDYAVFEGNADTPADVGSKPEGASWVGALDMSGNVWEWVSSAYQSYPYRADDGREHPQNTDKTARVIRGGSFNYPADELRASNRKWNAPGYELFYVGVRCVRDS